MFLFCGQVANYYNACCIIAIYDLRNIESFVFVTVFLNVWLSFRCRREIRWFNRMSIIASLCNSTYIITIITATYTLGQMKFLLIVNNLSCIIFIRFNELDSPTISVSLKRFLETASRDTTFIHLFMCIICIWLK